MLPKALKTTIEALSHLPGVGPRTAERYAVFLFKNHPQLSQNIADTLSTLHDHIKTCPVTFALMDADDTVSPLYSDPAKNKQTVLVVEEPLDIYAIEQTRQYHGTYHVLGGALSPIDGITADQLHIEELLTRIKTDAVQEVIIATNPSIEGESTALLLQKLIAEKYPKLKITRLARGLPLGVDLAYADQITLTAALEHRTKL